MAEVWILVIGTPTSSPGSHGSYPSAWHCVLARVPDVGKMFCWILSFLTASMASYGRTLLMLLDPSSWPHDLQGQGCSRCGLEVCAPNLNWRLLSSRDMSVRPLGVTHRWFESLAICCYFSPNATNSETFKRISKDIKGYQRTLLVRALIQSNHVLIEVSM